MRTTIIIIALISNKDESDYTDEVVRLSTWCSEDNLSLILSLSERSRVHSVG